MNRVIDGCPMFKILKVQKEEERERGGEKKDEGKILSNKASMNLTISQFHTVSQSIFDS